MNAELETNHDITTIPKMKPKTRSLCKPTTEKSSFLSVCHMCAKRSDRHVVLYSRLKGSCTLALPGSTSGEAMSESDDEWEGPEPKKVTRAEQLCLDGRASQRKVADWIGKYSLSERDACASALETGWPMSAPMARGRNLAPMAADSWEGRHFEATTSVNDFPTPPPAAVDESMRRFSFSEVGDHGQISDRTMGCGDKIICQPSPLGDVSGGGVWSRGQAGDGTTAPLCSMSPPRDDSQPSTRCVAQAERLQSHSGNSSVLLHQPISGAKGISSPTDEYSREPLGSLDDGRPGAAHAATHPPSTTTDGAFRRRSPMPTLSTSLDAHGSQSSDIITTMTHRMPRNGRPAHLYVSLGSSDLRGLADVLLGQI
jgi:hypothetical protein